MFSKFSGQFVIFSDPMNTMKRIHHFQRYLLFVVDKIDGDNTCDMNHFQNKGMKQLKFEKRLFS